MINRFWRPYLTSVTLVVALIALFPLLAMAEIPYRSYTYDFYKHVQPAPQAYLPERVVMGSDLGLSGFNRPEDVFVDDNQTIYIVDTGNSRIIHTDSEFNVLRIIAEFERNGNLDRLRNPSGVFVDKHGEIYIADTGNQRVVVLDQHARFVKQVDTPKPTGDSQIADNFAFIPLKLAVDNAGNLLVVVKDVYEGLILHGAGQPAPTGTHLAKWSGFVLVVSLNESTLEEISESLCSSSQTPQRLCQPLVRPAPQRPTLHPHP